MEQIEEMIAWIASKLTRKRVVVLGRSKEDAVGFKNLLPEHFHGRRERAIDLEIGVEKGKGRDVDVLDLHPVDGFFAQLDCWTHTMKENK